MNKDWKYVCPICHYPLLEVRGIDWVRLECNDIKDFLENCYGQGSTLKEAYDEILNKLRLNKNQIEDLDKLRESNLNNYKPKQNLIVSKPKTPIIYIKPKKKTFDKIENFLEKI